MTFGHEGGGWMNADQRGGHTPPPTVVEAKTTPPCRVCGKVEPVLECPGEAPQLAVCPDCCDKAEHPTGETGHRFEYDRWERDRVCVYCGTPSRCTSYGHDY